MKIVRKESKRAEAVVLVIPVGRRTCNRRPEFVREASSYATKDQMAPFLRTEKVPVLAAPGRGPLTCSGIRSVAFIALGEYLKPLWRSLAMASSKSAACHVFITVVVDVVIHPSCRMVSGRISR